MDWIEVSIETTPAGIDYICAKIIALGIEGMQIEDYDDFRSFLRTINNGTMSTKLCLKSKKAPTP